MKSNTVSVPRAASALIDENLRILVMSISGNTGKTTLSRHLLLPSFRNARLLRSESINDSGESKASLTVRGKHFEKIAEVLASTQQPVIVDIGSSNIEDVCKVLQNFGSKANRLIDMIVVPCTTFSKYADVVKLLSDLSDLGIDGRKIFILKNRVNDVDMMDSDFVETIAAAKAFGVTVIDRPVIELEVYTKLDHLPGTINEVLADPTDYEAATKAALAGNDLVAAKEAIEADFRRSYSETAVKNMKKVRADLFDSFVKLRITP